MAATGALKERIQLLQAAQARATATGKELKPEVQAELDSYTKQGLISGPGNAATKESENTAAFLATRLAGGLAKLKQVKGGDSPSLGAEMVRGVFGDTAANYVTGDDRQRVEAAQSDMLDAALTLGTGAAYNAEQLIGYRKAYFPQLGDSESTITDKRERLSLLLGAARLKAGAASPEIDAALKAAGFTVPDEKPKGGDQASAGVTGAVSPGANPPGAPPASDSPPPANADAGGTVQFNDEAAPKMANAMNLTDDQWATFKARAMAGATADELKGLATGFGRAPDEAGMKNIAGIASFYANEKNRTIPLAISYQRDELKPVDPKDGATGAVVRGAANVGSVGLVNKLGAVADTVSGDGTYAENLDRRAGYDLYDEQNHPLARVAGQVGAGVAIPSSAAGAARAAGIAAVRAGEAPAAARLIAARTFATRTAAEAAGFSGAYSFNQSQEDLPQRLAGAGASAAVGGLVGGGMAYGGSRIAQVLRARAAARGTPVMNEGQAALAAAGRQDIIPFPADVAGPGVRRLTAAVSQTMGGAGPIRAGAEATQNSAEAVRNRVAASIGAPQGVEEAGETARAGVNAFIARTGQRIGRIYDAAAEAGGRAQVDTPEARRVLDQELAPVLESPVQGPGVPILQGLRDALEQPQTVRGLREARSQIREQFENAGLRGSNLERIANRVVDAANDDLVNGLRAQGLDNAARQYRVADRMWRERLATIDDQLTPIVGDASGPGMKSGEQIVQGLKSAMAGNNRRFAGFINALPPQEQGIVRASLIQRLGRATKGNQDQEGEVFSLGTFLTNWDEIGERAKVTLFGAEGRAALNDLAIYANQSKQSQKYANTSNTAGAVSNLSAIWNFTSLGTALAAENVGARLLAWPRFARWLARAPRQINPAAQQAYVARLSRVARAEPAIANEVIDLQRRLTEAFAASPTRLAAEKRSDEGAPIQGDARQQNSPTEGAQP
jgi:hypothetical protein